MASPLALAMMTPQGYSPGSLQPTNVENAYGLSQNAAEQNYQAQLAQNNAMWGGLAGLGSAGILAAPKLFGAGGPFASTAAGAAGSAAAPAASAAGAGIGGIPLNLSGLPGMGSAVADAFAPAAADTAAAAAPTVAADLAASAAPAAADAAGSFSIADIIPLLAGIFA